MDEHQSPIGTFDLPSGGPTNLEEAASLVLRMLGDDLTQGRLTTTVLVTFHQGKARLWQFAQGRACDEQICSVVATQAPGAIAVVTPVVTPADVPLELRATERCYSIMKGANCLTPGRAAVGAPLPKGPEGERREPDKLSGLESREATSRAYPGARPRSWTVRRR